MAYEIYLKKNEEKRIAAGHSWVYANEVARIEGKDKNGSLASVFSYDGRFIGKGYINHASKILVRIFIRGDETDDRQFYLNRLRAAWDYRRKLGYENCCRVVFAEADNLPALIVDKYGDYLSVQCLSLGIDMRKAMITDCLVEIFRPRGIFERSDVALRKKEGLSEVKGVLYGEVPDIAEIEENGLKMLVDIKNGQKTGYFLDQKENRFAARRYAAGGEVLDCFCNSGGFSLNCATVAKHVTACDISQAALDNVMRNARLNGLENIDTVCGDAFELLRFFRRSGKKFDLVILDPPAFCISAAEVKDAYRGYKDINLQGMKLVGSGGFLITCSCSHYMTATLFERMLAEAAKESGRVVKSVEIKTQAPDHPSLLCADETHYLKFYVLNII
ncbi:MAG TPA: class I SAM-dependent rRNA methyltransferase [Candidatus Coproplasma stercoripullorum]|uniref:Class I SAM-dependent rRNA methyltransferase n=1 Tax=Candidatus Coproplasma stercoripullorum TaxID=2840751 RepID=A0A9D1DBN8_9FIRM|nr:class I SAM-dependent rRNA methyltransferase [Candidatus Coproplasma stercoripullorum]